MKWKWAGNLRKWLRDPRAAFYLISAAGILGYLIASQWLGQSLYIWMIQENDPDIRFVDYFAHLSLSRDPQHLYQLQTWDAMGCFPPLAYCLYALLNSLTSAPGQIPAGAAGAEKTPGALSVFTIYLIFNAVVFFLAIGMTGKKNSKRDLLIFTLLMLSAVFGGSGYMTGNSTMMVLAMLIAGLRLRESEKPLRREIGIQLLSACVALKLYPAVFGLLFLKERRWKELLRFALYSALLLFGPFVFFGGKAGLAAWLRHLTATMQYSDFGRLQYLMGVFRTLQVLLKLRENPLLCKALTVAVCLVWTLLAWRSRSQVRTVFFLVCIMVFFPSNAYRYSLSYLSIPLIMLLKEDRDPPEKLLPARISMGLYGMLYTVPVWWLLVIPISRRFRHEVLTSVEIYLYLVVYSLIAWTIIVEIFEDRRAAPQIGFGAMAPRISGKPGKEKRHGVSGSERKSD